jgi:Flp pilus assembly protein TadG
MRGLVWMLASVVLLLTVIDGGSIFLTRMSLPDAARDAGYAAATAADGQPTTRRTALVAYNAAREEGEKRGLRIRTKNFTLYPDGKVKLTATRTAGTFILHRFPSLSHLADVRATVTVSTLPFATTNHAAGITR